MNKMEKKRIVEVLDEIDTHLNDVLRTMDAEISSAMGRTYRIQRQVDELKEFLEEEVWEEERKKKSKKNKRKTK